MTFYIITLFPQTFDSVFSKSIIKRAIDKKLVKINFINPRDFAKDKHKTVDDTPYGGGRGMIMRADILVSAIESIKPRPYTILLSASGKKYHQKMAQTLSRKGHIALICGHYEGTDARIENFVDDVISTGDYVLTGGEIPAMAIVDSVTRLIPTVIHPQSPKSESFFQINDKRLTINGLLEYPQYTRPEEFRTHKVPKILLSGNHKKIDEWRQKETVKRTRKHRPDLLPKH